MVVNSKLSKDAVDLLQQAAAAVLSGVVFQRSKANGQMLTYLLTEICAGRAERINEYSIAIDLLGRDGDFDPSADPIVRVRMRRLREALGRHYANEAPSNGPKIVLPKGRYLLHAYVPDMEASQTVAFGLSSQSNDFLRLRTVQWLSVLFLSLAGAAMVWDIWQLVKSLGSTSETTQPQPLSDYPLIDIFAFQNVTGLLENDRYERDFQLQLAADIQNFERLQVRVVSLDTPKHTPAEAPHFKRVGSLLHLDEKIDIFASLIDVESGVQILAKRFSTDVEQDNISTALSTVSEIVSGPIEGQIGAVSHFFRTKWR